MSCAVLLMPENDHDWFHRNGVSFLLKNKTNWVVLPHNIFAVFLIFHQRNGDNTSWACYKVHGVDKLITTWIYTRRGQYVLNEPFLYQECIILSDIFCGDWQWYSCRKFLLSTFLYWETYNIRAKFVVSAHSVRKAWYWYDILPRQGQYFNPVLLFIITLAGSKWPYWRWWQKYAIYKTFWPSNIWMDATTTTLWFGSKQI